MTWRPLPVAAVARFRDDLTRVAARARAGAALPDTARLAVAVSGGADSMAMLRLAAAAFPGRVVAATFDHRLRDGSAREAAMVARVCERLDVPHSTLAPATPITGSSIQMRARTARYAALADWVRTHRTPVADPPFLLTAHHADDQAETLLMRLNRASGVSGLAAIRAARWDDGVLVLRPLLEWRRADLRALAEDSATPFVDDPGNVDPRHDRTRIRALLAATPALDPAALARSAAWLAEADDALSDAAARLWTERWQGVDRPFAIAAESRELRRRLVRRAIAAARAHFLIDRPAYAESANVEPLLDALEAGRGAVHGGVLVRAGREGWNFFEAPPRR